MNEYPVARETFTLLQSHFDLLWKLAGTGLAGAGGVIVFLFMRLMAQSEKVATALTDNTEALKDLRETIRDGQK